VGLTCTKDTVKPSAAADVLFLEGPAPCAQKPFGASLQANDLHASTTTEAASLTPEWDCILVEKYVKPQPRAYLTRNGKRYMNIKLGLYI
jgi:hypothetical protein